MTRRLQFHVRPRFTSGSPALVPAHTAQRVAAQERQAFAHALSGIYGEDGKRKAETEDLDFIAFTMYETRKGWQVEDLITGKRHFWPFKATCPGCFRKNIECTRGTLHEHSKGLGCLGQSYVGQEVHSQGATL